VIYSGLFSIFDTQSNIDYINELQREVERDVLSAEKSEVLIDTYSQNTAIVYRRKVSTSDATAGGTASQLTGVTNTSIPSSTKINNVTFTISTNSSLIIDGYEWTTQQIKDILQLGSNPTNLSIRTDSLFSSDKFLDNLFNLSKNLQILLVTDEDKTKYSQTQQNFKNTNP
jgi:hypothetical protein